MQLTRRRVRVKGALIALSVAAALVTALVAPAVPAFASSQVVTVNLSSGVGAGFLYGLSQDGTRPGDGLLASLPSGSSAQWVELRFTANTGWPAAQVSELQILP
jgi:hypothetical protein